VLGFRGLESQESRKNDSKVAPWRHFVASSCRKIDGLKERARRSRTGGERSMRKPTLQARFEPEGLRADGNAPFPSGQAPGHHCNATGIPKGAALASYPR